jgi:valyl-tRNA synthetase
VRSVRRWRDLVGVPAGAVLPARMEGADDLIARLARLSFDGADGEPLATIGPVEVLASGEVDADEVGRRIDAERERLRGEVERGERKLANEGFVAKAPEDVVAEERAKLERYRRELEELG